MSKTLKFKFYQNAELISVISGLDSAQSGQRNIAEWHAKTLSRFVDIWKLWQKKCLLMRLTRRKLALLLLREIRSRSLTLSQRIDVNSQVIFT